MVRMYFNWAKSQELAYKRQGLLTGIAVLQVLYGVYAGVRILLERYLLADR